MNAVVAKSREAVLVVVELLVTVEVVCADVDVFELVPVWLEVAVAVVLIVGLSAERR